MELDEERGKMEKIKRRWSDTYVCAYHTIKAMYIHTYIIVVYRHTPTTTTFDDTCGGAAQR